MKINLKGLLNTRVLAVWFLLVPVFLCVGPSAFAQGEQMEQTEQVEQTDQVEPAQQTEQPSGTEANDGEYIRGQVLELLEDMNTELSESEESAFTITRQMVKVKILEGDHQGEIFTAEFSLNQGMNDKYKSNRLRVKDQVMLLFEEDEAGKIEAVYVTDFARDKYIWGLVAFFVVLLILVGGMKGLKAIFSLGLTIVAVIKIMLPAILNGWDPVLISVAICVGIIIISMLILNGFNQKTLAAVLGTSGGVIVAGIVALVFSQVARLSGLGEEETQMLMYIPQNISFNFRGLLFSGILISTMGATMDVGMSIASAMNEIKAHNPLIKPFQLIKAGMNVGRDVIGTMTDTLILAYAGSSLPMMLLFMAYETPLEQIMNWDVIASEILRALAGSIGIIVAVPLTAIAIVALDGIEKNRKKYEGI